jgi:hypothetical protein
LRYCVFTATAGASDIILATSLTWLSRSEDLILPNNWRLRVDIN